MPTQKKTKIESIVMYIRILLKIPQSTRERFPGYSKAQNTSEFSSKDDWKANNLY